jgi:pimeloyl-ACP methyl ester carboxylesterase
MENRFIHIFRKLILVVIIMTVNTAQSQGKGQYAQVNGIKMYYEIHGTGEPLVLIHGGGSTLETTFGRIMPFLAKNHKVIAVELQAHGHTSDRDKPETFEQDADDVAELLRQLDIAKANIFGFSNGGNTAMQVAIRHPKSVRKLVIASAFYKREGLYPWLWEFMKEPKIEMMPQVYKDVYLSINPGYQKGLQAMHDHDSKRMQGFKDWKDEDLASIKSPALIVIGDQDVVKPEHAVAMSRLIKNSRLMILPATHGSYIGEIMTPDTDAVALEFFSAQVSEFLNAPMHVGSE